MVRNIKDNGTKRWDREMVQEYNSGKMEVNMRVCGEMIKQMAKAE